MTLPTFLVIGAMKAGTTSLWSALRRHPQVFMPAMKEPEFFLEHVNWRRGLEWYKSLFDGAEAFRAIGEASVGYSKAHVFRDVPERIARTLPDAKLIYLLRNPIERMRSHYLHFRIDGFETRSPERAFRENAGYLQTSCYAYQLEHYLEHFERERILLITTESLHGDQLRTLHKICAFIGVDAEPLPVAEPIERNVTAQKQVVTLGATRAQRTLPYKIARKLAPVPIRRAVGSITRRQARTADVHISSDLEAELRERLRPDVAELRKNMEPGFDGWGIA